MTEVTTGNNKYRREITQTKPGPTQGTTIIVDVYDVIVAFDVECPTLQHAIKKLLCCGQRGHKDALDDLREIIQAIERASEMRTVLSKADKPAP